MVLTVKRRCEDLKVQADIKAKEMRMELKVQLMFLPDSVRKMPWKTLMEDFGGSLENVIQNVKEHDYRQYVAASPLKVQYTAACAAFGDATKWEDRADAVCLRLRSLPRKRPARLRSAATTSFRRSRSPLLQLSTNVSTRSRRRPSRRILSAPLRYALSLLLRFLPYSQVTGVSDT